MTLGPVMVDLAGPELRPDERELLLRPEVGGVILFARNIVSPAQLTALVDTLHALRSPALLVAIDQEGGRVQRCRDGFTTLPPVRLLGHLYDASPREAREVARLFGWLLAAELRACHVDLSFAPVLDLDRGVSQVIGDRALHRTPEAVAVLGQALMLGMRDAGMAAVGKHFPGHGGAVADSHVAEAVDRRDWGELLDDIEPFRRMIDAGLPAVMMGHVIYPEVDPRPAGFSPRWIREELRVRLGFEGAVFSDDLSMRGAVSGGGPSGRAQAALDAGCDMVLVCNEPAAARRVVSDLEGYADPAAQLRLVRLRPRRHLEWSALRAFPQWHDARERIARLAAPPGLVLDAE